MAFGKDEETEPHRNAHLIGKEIRGQVGLLFTSLPPAKINEFFKNLKVSQFAGPGQVAIANVEL